jgi:capsid protein
MLVNPLEKLFGKPKHGIVDDSHVPTISMSDMPHVQIKNFDGESFDGGFGATQLLTADYWTLRTRSSQLFKTNLYAKGIIRRLVTNEINTGLTPELSPEEEIIGVKEDSLIDWTESVENRFLVWGSKKEVCDFRGIGTFGAIQRAARMEALVAGDVLVVLRMSPITGLPQVQLISGNSVRTPWDANPKKGNEIKHGVELDPSGRHVAFWIQQNDGSFKRLPARGEKSGRQLAWLVYGTELRLDEVRGEPILSILLQSLREIDRYRSSAQRKAVINSVLAMFIKRTQNGPPTLPMTGGAKRKDSATVVDGDGTTRTLNLAKTQPGIVAEHLQPGEEPVGFHSQGVDEQFSKFEEAITSSMAWALEIPPEILRLSFSNNYSASQAAINEFKIYLNKFWGQWGEDFCSPIFNEWLLSELLSRRIVAKGLLDAWRDPNLYHIFGAWTMCDWYGSIKPSTDMYKQGRGSKLLVNEGWSTNSREARVTTGTRFSKNIKRLKKENEQKAEAARPLAEFQQEYGTDVEEVLANAVAS